MDWQVEGDGWLLLSSRPLPNGGWRSRIRRYAIREEKPKLGQIVIELDAPLPAWSLAGSFDKKFVGFGPPPFKDELMPRTCDADDKLSGLILMLVRADKAAK